MKIIRKKEPVKYVSVPVDQCVPNTWNYNVMEGDNFEKLVRGISDLIQEDKEVPPITVRPHPSEKEKYEIIDGYHRWKAFQKLSIDSIPVFILNVKNKTARILTSTLNYNRGRPDPVKQAGYLRELSEISEVTIDDLADLLPESKEQLKEIAEAYDISFKKIKIEDPNIDLGDDGKSDRGRDDLFVTLQFPVSVSQSDIIESEIERISSTLEGKNLRGRALEFMAVNSALTPLEEVRETMVKETERRLQLNPKAKVARIKTEGEVVQARHVIKKKPRTVEV